MVIGVLGGTGTVGREVVAELDRRGHAPVVLSRGAPPLGEHRRVDVTSGEGLADGMAGLDALVDVVNGRRDVLVEGVARALRAARTAGVGHVVSLSILGSDRVPLGYYRAKMAQEAAVRDAGIPWSILRATQFHALLATVFAAGARMGVLPIVRVPVQPVDPREVAAALAGLAQDGPTGAIGELAGPRVERMDDLARAWARARGVRRLPLRVPAVGSALRAVRDGALTDPAAPRGSVSFAAWLERAA
ncbi:MAG: hypothetical protein QOH43_767 [Solirubrobacteraceae bacterium]|jgi:uncharacterized protein YbjT (DUF2867 family)|nr:hypothetical protein [Solirubrobacteraceae bacterium]